jgi:hypothetical protein
VRGLYDALTANVEPFIPDYYTAMRDARLKIR